MTLNLQLLDRWARELDEPEPPIYGRVCQHCGHLELSGDPLLVVTWRECPSCSVRGGGDHGRS